MKLRLPTDFVYISKDSNKHGYHAYDFGWSRNHGGQNVPIFASGDGVVTFIVDGKDNTFPKAGYGNYIKVSYGEITVLVAHVKKGTFKVKVGDAVVFGQELCRMNSSGNSTGCHAHVETHDNKGKRLDPLKYLYAYEGIHTVCAASAAKYPIQYVEVDPKDERIKELENIIIVATNVLNKAPSAKVYACNTAQTDEKVRRP